MKKVLLSLFIVACVFVVTGCGSKKSSSMAGTYKLVEMKEGSTKISADLLKTAGIDYTLVVKDDKTAAFTMGTEKQEMKYDDEYFWPADDKDQKASYTYKDGKITIKADSTSMTFEK